MLLPPFESFTPLNVILSATSLIVLTFIVNTFDNHTVFCIYICNVNERQKVLMRVLTGNNLSSIG